MTGQQETQFNRTVPVDDDLYTDLRLALRDHGPAYPETPYGATKTAELNVQFSMDPSFGLSRERYGWYSDDVLFDSTNFDTTGDRIQISTAADGASSARIRSAYPGQYISHTIAEPGLGAEIDASDVEIDSDNLVSLTHGEISFEVGSVETATTTGINAHGISFESDATYHQVRVDGEDIIKVPQSDWNIDSLDGDGPSGLTLRPQDGYVYQFIYSWYGEGAMVLAIQDPENGIIPLNIYTPDGPDNPPFTSPNLPIQVGIENQGTADSLGVTLGGMQYATHGTGDEASTTRTTEEARHPASGFIGSEVVLTDEAVDPYSTTLAPLMAAKRDADLTVQKGLRFELGSAQVNTDSSIYLFIFDEFDEAAAGLDGTFTDPASRNGAIDESEILTNTTCTTYTPSTDSVLRGFAYIPSTKDSPALTSAGDTSSRIPLQSTVVIAAALAPGEAKSTPDPALVQFKEGF